MKVGRAGRLQYSVKGLYGEGVAFAANRLPPNLYALVLSQELSIVFLETASEEQLREA